MVLVLVLVTSVMLMHYDGAICLRSAHLLSNWDVIVLACERLPSHKYRWVGYSTKTGGFDVRFSYVKNVNRKDYDVDSFLNE